MCGDDELCIFDIAATGELSIGEATRESREEQKSLEDILQPSMCNHFALPVVVLSLL